MSEIDESIARTERNWKRAARNLKWAVVFLLVALGLSVVNLILMLVT